MVGGWNASTGKIRFGYDALGRRTYKEVKNIRTNWLWDGNTPLHEWQSTKEEPRIDIITWVFEAGSFVPCARITDKGSQSIVTDYLGTPTRMFDSEGKKTWEAELDIYGRVRTFAGSSLKDCPFRYQGQYQDEETGLYYNRFRYYDSSIGGYISPDPIGLAGGNPTLYGYVKNTNFWLDLLGLVIIPTRTLGNGGELVSATATVTDADLGTGTTTNKSTRAWARQNGIGTDDAGHIIRRQLGGSGRDIDNIFPQDFHVNRGQFAQFEGIAADFVDVHGSAKITVEFEYDTNISKTRPTAVIYTAEAPNGERTIKRFNNSH
jgi:RHS repeat-associated protein